MALKVESGVRQIPYRQETVYDTLSDLSHLERIKDKIPADKVERLSFDSDNLSFQAPMVGEIKLRVVEREAPKTVKMESVASPLAFHFWIQLLPVGEDACKMRLTVQADVPMMVRGMVEKPLKEVIEKIADGLAMIPYGD